MSAETSVSGAAGTGNSARTTNARDFILPDLGEGLTEAELISWLVNVGDEVHVDQMVVEVESAKSVVELPCPFAGRIEALHANAGDTVSAGQSLLSVAEKGAEPGAGAGSAAEAGAGLSATADSASSSAADSDSGGANLIGYGTSEPKARSTKKRSFGAKTSGSTADHAAATAVTPPASAAEPSVHTAPEAPAHTAAEPAVEVPVSPVSSPIVRKLAKDNGLSAKHLAGTGPGGIVTRADVLKAIESGAMTSPSTAPIAATTASVPTYPALTSDNQVGTTTSAREESTSRDTRTPITGLRKVVSERLTKSRQEIPEATIWLDVDATELLNTKRALEARTGEKYSLLSLVARFVIAGLKKHPIINSSIDTEANEIVTHGDINLGLAAQTPRGLMVPVVHGADEMSLRQLRDSVSETVGKASTGKFNTAELTGGTFTLNNYGVFGVDGSAPIINLPEVAMLGLGRIKERPWVVDGELTVRKVMFLSFVFDHRACDGAEPSQFLTFIADCIENPISLLPEL